MIGKGRIAREEAIRRVYKEQKPEWYPVTISQKQVIF